MSTAFFTKSIAYFTKAENEYGKAEGKYGRAKAVNDRQVRNWGWTECVYGWV